MMQHNEAELLAHLLTYYGFELAGNTVEQCVSQWRDRYPEHWLRSAVVEALYQGRYKVISVVQILDMWQRRGQSLCHYNGEFERMICNKFLTLTFSESAASRSLPIVDAPALELTQPDDDGVEDVSQGGSDAGRVSAADGRPSPSRPASAPAVESGDDDLAAEASLLQELEDELVDLFRIDAERLQGDVAPDAAPPQAIPPFKPSADVPAAARRFKNEAIAFEPAPHTLAPITATSEIYNRLKAALNRVVSTPTDEH